MKAVRRDNHNILSHAAAGEGLEDSRWKHLTREGNEAFARKQYKRSGQWYQTAWLEACDLFECAARGDPMVGVNPAPLLVVSAANLAENFSMLGTPGRSEAHLKRVIALFVGTLHNPKAPVGLRRDCLFHLHRALLELVPRMKANAVDEATISELVSSTKETALTSLKDLNTAN